VQGRGGEGGREKGGEMMSGRRGGEGREDERMEEKEEREGRERKKGGETRHTNSLLPAPLQDVYNVKKTRN